MDTHGQRPSTSAIVFVITGPWHLTLGDTMCFVTVTRAMLLSSMWSKGLKWFQIFWCFSSPATFLLSVSGPPISPQVPVEETLNQVKTENSEIYYSLWSIFQKYDFCEIECGSELLPGPPITIVASVPHTVGSYKQFNST